MHVNALRALGSRAMLYGAVYHSPIRFEWDLHRRCTRPARVDLFARPDRDAPTSERLPHWGQLNVPCRKCLECRTMRSNQWRQRALREFAVSSRTRMLTFTFAPTQHYRADQRIRRAIPLELAKLQSELTLLVDLPSAELKHFPWAKRAIQRQEALQRIARSLAERSVPLSGPDSKILFDLRQRELGKELTLFLKRLRERYGASLRYLLVAEQHTDRLAGRPHFHMLLHELDHSQPLRSALIKASWRRRLGHMHAKLRDGDTRAAGYVTKYLTKSPAIGIRASKFYGGVRPAATTCGHTDQVGGGTGEPFATEGALVPPHQERQFAPEMVPGTTRPLGQISLKGLSLEETFDAEGGTVQGRATPDPYQRGCDTEAGAGAVKTLSQLLEERATFEALMKRFGPDLDLSNRLLGRRRLH